MQTSVYEERYRFIGGSDIPIIMSLSPFKTRWQLLKEKAQVEESCFQGNIYTEYGNIMEPKIRDYINEALGFQFEEGKAIGGDVRIHTDGEDILKRCILEVKTTSKIHEDINDYKMYLVQLLFYMCERDFENGLLAVYERPEDMSTEFDPAKLLVYSVERKDYVDLINEIYEEVDLFRRDLEKVRKNPFMTEEELLPEETRLIARRLIAIKEAEAYFKSEFMDQKDILIARLGELYAEEKRKTAEVGGYKVTYTAAKEAVTKTERKLDEELLKSTYAEIYDRCLKEVTKTTSASKARVTITEVKV